MPWIPPVAAIAAGAVLYGVLVERRWFRVVRRRVPILPAGGPGTLTVLHLSDLHVVRGDAFGNAERAELFELPVTPQRVLRALARARGPDPRA